MTTDGVITFLICVTLLFGIIAVVVVSAGSPDCEVIFQVDRQEGSLSMINEVRPTERAQILDCGGTLVYKRGPIP